jgi:hypothetical protein
LPSNIIIPNKMDTISNDYYVYVYIDPRNYEEFYYGKGKGNRKDAHLKDKGDSDKAQKIREIEKAGLKPIIRVIAKGLTEKEAFLVEKTLLWKLGKTLTNISKGQLKAHFRPFNTMYKEIPEFDFSNDLYYVNVGEGWSRNWDDCRRYGFLSAGQGVQWSEPMKTLSKGDLVVAYLKGKGYVGIGIVKEKAVSASHFRHNHKSLHDLKLVEPGILTNYNNANAEFLVKVKWLKSFPREEAKWQSGKGLFTSQQIVARLRNQTKTIKFLEKEFGVDILQ